MGIEVSEISMRVSNCTIYSPASIIPGFPGVSHQNIFFLKIPIDGRFVIMVKNHWIILSQVLLHLELIESYLVSE